MQRRILGLETEYALLFQPHEGGRPRPTPRKIYEALSQALEATYISLEALYRKEGRFLSNSVFIHYEAHADAFSHGLVEGATPECRTPLDVITYQRAIDEILAGVAQDAEGRLNAEGWSGKVLIGKNSVDAFGHSYGCHENYLVQDPVGLLTRILLGAGLVTTLLFLVAPFVLAVLSLTLVALTALFTLLLVHGGLRSAAAIPIAGVIFEGLDRPLRSFIGLLSNLRDENLAKATGLILKFGLYPAITFYSAYLSRLILRKYKKYLTAHLISRTIFSGSGDVSFRETETGYRISQRAPHIRRVMKVYWDDANKPIFDIKQFVFEPFAPFRRAKRLHILFSDSNMAEFAQYLKIGTTALVIDAIERGVRFPDVVLRSPLKALREISRVGHAARMKTTRGEDLSALEIQRRYLDGVRRSTTGEELPPEDRRILDLWETALRGIDKNPMDLERELDWVIKKRLLDRKVLETTNWSETLLWGRILEEIRERLGGPLPERIENLPDTLRRKTESAIKESGLDKGRYAEFRHLYYAVKKLDLKYHQIAPRGGYFEEMERSGLAARITDPAAVQRAKVEPPQGTRARARGAIIRWIWDRHQKAQVGWNRVALRGLGKVIRLDDPFDDQVDFSLLEDPRYTCPE